MSKAIKREIILTAAYYGRELFDDVVNMYCDDLEEYSEHVVIEAYKEYRRNPKNKFMPLPAQIIEIIDPVETTESQAVESSARIFSAVTRFGHNNVGPAREYIGELGWEVVRLYGGWGRLCENLTPGQIPILQAQFREIAKSVYNKNIRGDSMEIGPSLPSPIIDLLKKNSIEEKLLEFKKKNRKGDDETNI